MKTERELLIELIGNAPASVDCIAAEADYLLANGVGFINGWINVKDRLPDKDGRYLCVVGSSFHPIRIMDFYAKIEFPADDRDHWKDESGNSVYNWFVKFWRPLPEPPKGGAK